MSLEIKDISEPLPSQILSATLKKPTPPEVSTLDNQPPIRHLTVTLDKEGIKREKPIASPLTKNRRPSVRKGLMERRKEQK